MNVSDMTIFAMGLAVTLIVACAVMLVLVVGKDEAELLRDNENRPRK